MTDGRIIEMAEKAGFYFHDTGRGSGVLHTTPLKYSQRCFERFEKLVREECAQVCDAKFEARAADGFAREVATARALADEIRSMGK